MAKLNKGKVCPYLGISQDPQTTLFFPSEQNVCHHSKPLASPNLEHQQAFCLKGRQHILCPVFTRNVIAPLPMDIRLPIKKLPFKRRTVLLILLGCAIIIFGGLGTFWAGKYYSEHSATLSDNPVILAPTSTTLPLATATFYFTDTLTYPTVETKTPLTQQTSQTPQMPTSTVRSISPLLTQTPVSCDPPHTWVAYIVQPGDSLYHLSSVYGITIAELQAGNCLGTFTLLYTGQKLYVPPLAVSTPSPTFPNAATPTSMPTYTPSFPLPSNTPTGISTSTATDIPTIPATDTYVEVPTNTPVPTTSG